MVWAQSCGKTNHYPNLLTGGEGFIPAHAGKTATRPPPPSSPTAHLRSHGENELNAYVMLHNMGSSPLTRGKPLAPSSPRSARWAHPRSRGENPQRHFESLSSLGSSPLTRGKQCGECAVWWRRGLIPAHAGKTGRFSYIAIWCWAHPRSCGENTDRSLMSTSGKGSSPLTRGKLGHETEVPLQIRLIPAHAGKTMHRPAASS